ncbi:uncharacterized protein LOC107045356 [Diachasma alloeum]|uniref:uncharacterized protein LOC107045356 n=1 Tax=Diachasma alloeum TaxID=454923 RepID=UPI0007383DAE|nr:uncharacterized protein LOC107045356 [Diachasma alloeum]
MNNHIGMDIASLLEVQVNEEPLPEVDSGDGKNEAKLFRASETVTPEEKHFRKLMFGQDIAKVRFRKLHCTSCDTHIGSAPAEAYNMQEHPVLKVLLCAACREFYGDGTFEQGDDATDMFCRWCANGGNLYCCSYCSNTFCQKCIRINFDAVVRKQIEADEKWKCFVCHPAPLYSHRAVCWALLQHVKTLSRILTADRVMTPKEILSKMELDDAQCCPGRKAKRKRRPSLSSSDDESVTSKTSRTSSRTRKRSVKRRRATSRDSADTPNGRYVPIAPRKIEDDDITRLLNPEQTMVEGDTESVILPGNPRLPALQPITTQTLVRPPVPRGGRMIPVRPLRRIDSLPPGATPQLITRLPGFRASTPMVTIPTRPVLITASPGASGGQGPRVRSYPNIRIDKNDPKLKGKAPPSVIDIESDSEDDPVVQTPSVQATKSSEKKSEESEGASGQSEAPDVTYPRLTVRRFDQTISNPMRAVDDILKKLRKRLKQEMSGFEAPQGTDINSAKMKLKIINRNISKVVSELAGFNNTMVRQYKPWKTSCITGTPVEDSTGKIRLRKGEASHKIIPLEMECERDSESEADEEDEEVEEHNSIDFSNKLVEFREKETVDQGCTARAETEDKGIQVYDEIVVDYDRTVGYSLLMRADYDGDKEVEMLKPVVVQDDYFGKYEEQFIFYLQGLEEGNDEEKENASPEKSLNEIIEEELGLQKGRKTPGDVDEEEVTPDVEDVLNEEMGSESNDIGDDETMENGEMKEDDETSGKGDEPMDVSNGSLEESAKANDVEKPDDEKIEEEKTDGGIDADGNNESCNKDPEKGQAKALSQEARKEATVIAVRALIEDEGRGDKGFKENWKGAEDDDECTILE